MAGTLEQFQIEGQKLAFVIGQENSHHFLNQWGWHNCDLVTRIFPRFTAVHLFLLWPFIGSLRRTIDLIGCFDHIGFGQIYDTQSKSAPDHRVTISRLPLIEYNKVITHKVHQHQYLLFDHDGETVVGLLVGNSFFK